MGSNAPVDTELGQDEQPIKEGRANLMRGPEAVGGKLYLTNQRLIFESHALNVQRGAEQVPLADVVEVGKVWTRVFGVLPLVPNSLAVTDGEGVVRRFVLNGRSGWATAIEAARRPPPA